MKAEDAHRGRLGRDTLAALLDRVNADIDSTRTSDELIQYFISVPARTERSAALALLRSGQVEWVMPDYTFEVGIPSESKPIDPRT